MLYKGIGTQNDKEADNALEQSDCAGLSEVEAVHHGTVYVGFDDVRGREQHRVVSDKIIKQAEISFQNTADGEQKQHNHGGLQGGQDNVANLLETVGSVDLCGFQHGGMMCVFKGREIHEPFHRQDFFFINYAWKNSYEALSAKYNNLITIQENE